MALVAYSDSETSDTEDAPQPQPAPVPKPAISKPQPGKLKVELPTIRPEPGQQDGEPQPPAAKRARTIGAFGGFNSMLPAPKRPAAQPNGLKKGVNLKTSSEAAFSRAPPLGGHEGTDVRGAQGGGEGGYDEFGNRTVGATGKKEGGGEVKIVGKATRFKPLSVGNKKKVVKKTKPIERMPPAANDARLESVAEAVPAAPMPIPKKSLFSVQQEEDDAIDDTLDDDEPRSTSTSNPAPQHPPTAPAPPPPPAQSNSLDAVAADLNLTPAQRRQLFGRHAKDVNITNVNMDNEYRANEQIRQSGETVEHRAVKSIAPGKHSLQQLVNNARNNAEGMEDKWAEGRRARGGGK